MYHVEFSKKALNELKKLDKPISTMILGWIIKNLESCKDPRSIGKPLIGDKKGQWRYRIGDYRIICKISDSKILIYILTVGHRKEVYKR